MKRGFDIIQAQPELILPVLIIFARGLLRNVVPLKNQETTVFVRVNLNLKAPLRMNSTGLIAKVLSKRTEKLIPLQEEFSFEAGVETPAGLLVVR
jgi:hypothetical protein